MLPNGTCTTTTARAWRVNGGQYGGVVACCRTGSGRGSQFYIYANIILIIYNICQKSLAWQDMLYPRHAVPKTCCTQERCNIAYIYSRPSDNPTLAPCSCYIYIYMLFTAPWEHCRTLQSSPEKLGTTLCGCSYVHVASCAHACVQAWCTGTDASHMCMLHRVHMRVAGMVHRHGRVPYVHA